MLKIGLGFLVGAAVSLGLALWLARGGLNPPAPPQEVLQGERWW